MTVANPVVGETFTVTSGTWTHSPTSFAYQWVQSPTPTASPTASIAGATTTSYTLASTDVGSCISCIVTATNATDSTSASSNVSGPVSTNTLAAKAAGMYSAHSISQLATVEANVGRTFYLSHCFLDSSTTWAQLEYPWILSASPKGDTDWVYWKNNPPAGQKRQLILSTPTFPPALYAYTGTNYAAYYASLGQPGDWLGDTSSGIENQHYFNLGKNLVAAGLGDSVIRIAWEANGESFAWQVRYLWNTTQFGQWKQMWRNMQQQMAAVPGNNFVFDWCINANYLNNANLALANWYPGDDVVDIISIDAYDSIATGNPPLTQPARWNLQLTQFNGINTILNFSAAHNKPSGFPEWGIGPVDGTGNNGNGDDPFYINGMAGVFANNRVAYQCYFHNGNQRIIDDGTSPNSLAAYQTQLDTLGAATVGNNQTQIVRQVPSGPASPTGGWTVVLADGFNSSTLSDLWGPIPNYDNGNLTSDVPGFNANEIEVFNADRVDLFPNGLVLPATYVSANHYVSGCVSSLYQSGAGGAAGFPPPMVGFSFQPTVGQITALEIVCSLPDPTLGGEDCGFWATDSRGQTEIDFFEWTSYLSLPAPGTTNISFIDHVHSTSQGGYVNPTPGAQGDQQLHRWTFVLDGTNQTFYAYLDGGRLTINNGANGTSIPWQSGFVSSDLCLLISHALRNVDAPKPTWTTGSTNFIVRSVAVYQDTPHAGVNVVGGGVADGTSIL